MVFLCEETVTLAHSEDKSPSVNCKAVSGRKKSGEDMLTPASGSVTGSVRRSARLNARLNPVPLSPGSNVDQESPSTAVVNKGSDGTTVDGQDSSVKKDNGGSSRRGRGKDNGSSKCRGKRKEADSIDDGNRGARGPGNRGKGKRKLNDGMAKETKVYEVESEEDSESSEDDEANVHLDKNHAEEGITAIAEPVDVEASSHQMVLTENNEVPSAIQINTVGDDVQQDVNPGANVDEQHVIEENRAPRNQNRITSRERFLSIARRRASHFAYFNPENGESSSSQQRSQPNATVGNDEERRDWPGPFSTARRLVEERATALAARQEKLSGNDNPASLVEWKPSRDKDFVTQVIPPSLYDLCLNLLCKHVEHIETLEGIPDSAKNRICSSFCALRKMTPRTLGLFITGSPTQIWIPDCSLIPEEDLTKLIAECSTTNLEVLQLGMCGRAFSDRLLQATFACSSAGLPCLTCLSLKGAYRLSDVGLRSLVQMAPLLSSVDLSQCSLLSEAGVNTLANSLASVIKELRLDSCQQLEPFKILPALKKMHKLEVLSLAGIPGVTDDFVSELLSYLGCDLKELSLADCGKLTDGALEAIGAVCCALNVLILDNLSLLTDTALGHLANGCRSLQTLSLKRCSFSDEAVAAFIDASGNCLSDLSLNNVKEVANHTVLALVSNTHDTLSRLDVSWCRNLTDEALGLLADSCSLLRELILFGCTQVTNKFLEGHSNTLLKVTGVKDQPLY